MKNPNVRLRSLNRKNVRAHNLKSRLPRKRNNQVFTEARLKSITSSALFISLILHLVFFVLTFYVVVQKKPISSNTVSIEAELIAVGKVLKEPKSRPKKSILRFHETPRDVSANVPIAKVESITPEIGIQPSIRSVPLVNRTEPRLKQAPLEPEVPSEVSTTSRALRNLAQELSTTEVAGVSGTGSFGSKRSGKLGIQRAPLRDHGQEGTTRLLDITEVEGDSDFAFDRKKPAVISQNRFNKLMKGLAQQIVDTSEGGPIDVVFVIDASGSMRNNIKAVAEHLTEMIDVYRSSKIDYALGLTEFWGDPKEKKNTINVLQLTKNLSVYKRAIRTIMPHQDENALDAIVQTVKELQFRPTSKRHFILVTDEPFTSLEGLTVSDAIAYCREFGIYVNVLGLPTAEHQALATQTGGKWHVIPEDAPPLMHLNTATTPRAMAQTLRLAEWTNVEKIGDHLLQKHSHTPVDIILFIDSSKSMEDKLPNLLKQFELMLRNWDNAFIDYEIGVVRFRTRASVNMVNVFSPPQTLVQIQKIAALPYQEDETLLDAIEEGLRRVKLRTNAQLYLILVTDEPAKGKYSALATIQLLQGKHAIVSVIGTYDDFQHEVAVRTGGVWIPIPGGHTSNNSYW